MGEPSDASRQCELCGGSGWRPGLMGLLVCDHRSDLELRLALDALLDYLAGVDPDLGAADDVDP